MKIEVPQSKNEIIEIEQWKFSINYGIIASPRGKECVLEPRLAKLLYYLSLNVGTNISREYLIDRIWIDTIVNDESLTRAIADLRKLLSIHFKDSIIIETIRKRGYKLSLKEDLKRNRLRFRVNPMISNTILGLILFVIFIWFVADLLGIVETKFINASK